jgi:hypothetical protein
MPYNISRFIIQGIAKLTQLSIFEFCKNDYNDIVFYSVIKLIINERRYC